MYMLKLSKLVEIDEVMTKKFCPVFLGHGVVTCNQSFKELR